MTLSTSAPRLDGHSRAHAEVSAFEGVVRLGQILAVVAAVLAGRSVRLVTGRRGGGWPETVALVIERLGPAFIKFAQIASTRQDVLPPRVCRALTRLHDSVAPMSADDLRSVLREHFGAGGRAVRDLRPEPLGAGSIACVYLAHLDDGTPVAVKVRRPNLESVVHRDVAILRTLFTWVGRLPGVRGVPLEEMARSVGDSVLRQLDLRAEAHNLASLREDLAGLDFVVVPQPLLPLCGETCVVMTFVPGVRQRVDVVSLETSRREVLADQALRAVFEMLFCTGLVHCDLHPGNLRLTPAESIVVLDAGFVYRVPEVVRRNLALFFLNLGFRNGPRCAEAVLASAGEVGPGARVEEFTADMTRLVHRFGGVTARDFDLIAFATELFASQRRNGIYARPEFVFPLLALLMVEETVRELDPGVDFQGIARPIVFRAAQGRPAGERWRRAQIDA